jgi:hypothetical protein
MSGTDGENLQKFAEPDSRSLLAGSGLGVIQRGLALDWSRAPWTFCAGHGELNLASLTPGSSAYTRLYWPIPLPIFGAATRCRPVRPRSPSDGIELNSHVKKSHSAPVETCWGCSAPVSFISIVGSPTSNLPISNSTLDGTTSA